MPETLLRVEGLTVRFAGADRDAVADFDLDLHVGETVALLGPSGAGKTAAVRAALGLAPRDAAVSGDVRWRDAPLGFDRRRRLLGRDAALVFQDAGASLDPCLRIGAQLDEVLRHAGVTDRARRRRRIRELCDETRLEPELVERHPHRLSGGEQQRAALALALATDPALLVADEPTTALDPVTEAGILDLLSDLVEARGMALILVTHDLRAAERCTGRALLMEEGRLVAQRASNRLRDVPDVAGTVAPPEPEADAPVVLDVRGLTVVREAGRGRRRTVLSDVAFDVRAGEALGVVGRSGSGKTTLAHVLGGFLSPAAGLVTPALGGSGPRPVQVIFQSPAAALDPRWTVLDCVTEAAAAAGESDPEAAARGLLADVELPETLRRRRPHALSGGERQRVTIARALAARPALLVADEPASSLDPPLRARLLDLLDELRRARGLALVLVSHDLDLVRRRCPRIAVLDDGAMVEIVKNGAEPTSPAGRTLWVGRT